MIQREMKSSRHRPSLFTTGLWTLLIAASFHFGPPQSNAQDVLAHAGSPATLRAEFDRALLDFDEALKVLTHDSDQAQRLFRSAAQRLESIVAAGIRNGPLEYNLGNCYLQAGDLGRAILHYRRAERLMPGEPHLADNISVALTRRLTHVTESRGKVARRTIFFWHEDFSQKTRTGIALATYALAWTLLAARAFFGRRWLAVTAGVSFALAALFGTSVGATIWADRNAPDGVVLASDTVAMKGPGPGYQRQFEQPLQPGVEFTLRERRGAYWSIELPDEQSCWIESSRAELIPWDAN